MDVSFVGWLCGFEHCATRCLWGCLVSIFCGFCVFPRVLHFFQQKNFGQVEREKNLVGKLAELHADKAGTPTFGGVAILLSVILPIFLFAKLNFYVNTALITALGFGLLGFADDFLKLYKRNIWGIRGKYKLVCEAILTLGLFSAMYFKYGEDIGCLLSPVLNIKDINFLSLFLILIFSFFVLTGTSNAVNITDGLDGLASITLLPNFAFFAILALFSGSECLSSVFSVHFLPGIEELAVVFSCFIGGLVVFLWYNSWPSSVMMGDTGSLMLGGLLGAGALLLIQPFFLLLTGVIFVLEALSDILQVSSCKLRKGRRLFLMAPVHHHFELSGIKEQKIVARAGLISFCTFLLGLLVLHHVR